MPDLALCHLVQPPGIESVGNVFRHGGEITTGYRPALRCFREVLAESSHVLRRPRVEGFSAGMRSLEGVCQIEGCRERLKISILPLRYQGKTKGLEVTLVQNKFSMPPACERMGCSTNIHQRRSRAVSPTSRMCCMVAVASCFAQILALIDRADFARAVRQHAAERAAKGFSCWDHLVAMLFCQMGSAHSLREICGGLATALGKLVHLGVRRTPTRSTLAYANAHRPWRLYETLFYQVLSQCQSVAASKRRRFRFKHPLRTLDSTIIELCATVFDWARFQRTKGAIKLHLQLDHQGCLPCWALVTHGDTNDASSPSSSRFHRVPSWRSIAAISTMPCIIAGRSAR